MMNFGAYLRALREEKKLSVNQLAMYSEVSAAGISRIENGKRGIPKPPTIKKLAGALKVPYEEMMQAAGYIEEASSVHQLKEEETALSKIKEAAAQYELGDLELFDGDIWSTLSKKEIEDLNRYLLFILNSRSSS
ncbi:helix-turn-helix domain-containing protein [Bacillus pumilus]|nr:helix-turn-helix domain-containing protein [Bacillus pumilus]MCR4352507.1 helix-turn-helix domain-containing protein [Bacillus pumilus]MCY7435924.1 helix-turn-helix domain-containing protein [Bacillus pumilus]MCY7502210.1 helix-turn-helix domain-containing protein [Bacillus pumilus]MCY7504316.1 helix-turn-helix domain-containing protein [Bacillus pumilus]